MAVDLMSASQYWNLLWQQYPTAPSIVLCRIPELEYAASLTPTPPMLDHCCGDGRFAKLAWRGSIISSGCDINSQSIDAAKERGVFEQLAVCDVSRQLPYEDRTFATVFNNSALEHIANLDSTLHEVGRVLMPEGAFSFNVLNYRYFEWWPMDKRSLEEYRIWQPFVHALSMREWEQHLAHAGLEVVEVKGYFDQRAAQELARIDYLFSGFYLARRQHPIVWTTLILRKLTQSYWKRRLGGLIWNTAPDEGAGYFIKAVRRGV